MMHSMSDSDGTSDQPSEGSQTQSTAENINPQAMEIIQTTAANFTQTIIQNPEAQQNIPLIITNYGPPTGFPVFGSSSDVHTVSLTTEEKADQKMKEDVPKIRCVVCLEDHPLASIAFSCDRCKSGGGRVCNKCMSILFSKWKAEAFLDQGLTVDTNQQIFLIYSKNVLACPSCRKFIPPGTYDLSLAWYKAPTFPLTQNDWLMISTDFADANQCDKFRNGFGQARFYSDYMAYLLGKPSLPGDCPNCGDGAGNYVLIKAKDAATFNRDPWQGGQPSCLICPAAPKFGPEQDLRYCVNCQKSILHPQHFNTTGQVEKGIFYTVVFK